MKGLRKNNSGFTLIELIVVMIIIGILVLLATPRFLNYVKDARVTALQVDAKVLGDGSLLHAINEQQGGNEGDYPIVKNSEKSFTELDEKLQKVVKYNLDESYSGTQDESNMVFAQLDGQLLEAHIRNTKNKIEDYYVVTEGPLEGVIFYKDAIENGRGDLYAGLIGLPEVEIKDY